MHSDSWDNSCDSVGNSHCRGDTSSAMCGEAGKACSKLDGFLDGVLEPGVGGQLKLRNGLSVVVRAETSSARFKQLSTSS
jgi:hypothetical protein